MHAQLLDRAAPERVARSDEHAQLVLQEPEADLGQVGRFADAIDADKRQCVGVLFGRVVRGARE